MELFVLQNIWYLVLCAAIVLYTILDGFDLGVGILHLFAKSDEDRRIFLNAIGPVWDGNEVWLIIVGGALFSGFPIAYASIFSGFYTLLMIFLAGLIFRAVAIEFRSKQTSTKWRHFWDVSFSVASIVISLGIGLALGNLIRGVPMNSSFEFLGTFWDFISPYTLVVGFLALSLCAMHGTIFLLMKTDGPIHDHVRRFMKPTLIFFFIMYTLASVMTLVHMPHMLDRMMANKLLFVFPVLALLSILNVWREVAKGNDGWAFISSSLSILFLFVLFGIGTYPVILRSTIDAATNSLTIFNSSSSPLTLKVLILIAVIGVPLVLAYGYWIYRIFRGKVRLDETSY